jgi:hypothetical protein
VTLPAVDFMLVKGVRGGPLYKVGPRCSNPSCNRWSEHAHHIVRRSALGGDFRWIMIDGRVVGNLTGVCPPCHDDLTGRIGGHKAAIRYEDGLFYWALPVALPGEKVSRYNLVGPITPQPPTPETIDDEQSVVSPPESSCPFCGQKRRHPPARKRGWGRRRKTWSVRVPADEVEDGADVLDTLIENLAPLIPNADSSAIGRYYVLVPVLAYATMDAKRFLETMEGVGA